MMKVQAGAVLLAVGLAATGCSGGETKSGSGNGSDKQITIGFALPVLANPFWRKEADFAKYVGEQLGNVKVVIVDAESDEGKQVQQVESLISQGVDGIIASPVTQAVGPALLRAAEQADIPMVFAERNPGLKPEDYKGEAYVGYVGANGRQGATDAAEQLYKAGARRVVAMAGKKGSSVADERVGGLMEFAKNHLDFEVLQVQYDAELQAEGLKIAENYLSAYPGPGFDAVWCYNDEGALGTAQAIKQAGLQDKVKITGFDGTAEATAAIINGEMLATAGGQFIDGGLALIMLYDAIHGKKPKNAYVEMPLLLIEPSNAAAYKEQFVDSLPQYDVKQLSQVFNESASTDDYKIELK
ncbi:MAG TPA: sugar ABC transporter substrate-binding protein [Micromonosporaceae bacterium]|nr:sugar ABC transporter substrate-binding protein [Micromonosporaceae bacterium]